MSMKQFSTHSVGPLAFFRRCLSLLATPILSLLTSAFLSLAFQGFSLLQLCLFLSVAFPALLVGTGIILALRP